ncbi:lysozyme inhibitor LprI family protein [Erwinia papayae]|uniref:Lysozyme inhibitor LprI family protein n=1 Tax=Erwinia papayae TaxID=206499 RepID=A0ABV3MW39_9GAMM
MKKYHLMVTFLFAMFVSGAWASAKDNHLPCMGFSHTVEVSACMFDLAESKKEAYTKEYKVYLGTITTKEERPYDKVVIAKLVREARKNWDIYNEKECRAEASVYEEDSYGFNDRYNSCLIKHYDERIKYYRENKL